MEALAFRNMVGFPSPADDDMMHQGTWATLGVGWEVGHRHSLSPESALTDHRWLRKRPTVRSSSSCKTCSIILTTSGERRPIAPSECLTLDRRPSLASAAFHIPAFLLQSASEEKDLPAPRRTASGKMNVLPTSTASQSSTVGPLAARYLFGPKSVLTGLFRKDIGFMLWTFGITGKPFRWPCSGVAESATKPSTDTVIGLRPSSDIDSAELSAGSDILAVSLWILRDSRNRD
jgi:hypothetical protein